MNLQASPRGRRSNGFTMIELLMVIAIIVVLAAIAISGFSYATNNAKRRATQTRLATVATSLESYALEYGEYPAVMQNSTIEIREADFDIGPSVALYQAISGDGNDHLVTGGEASDGEFTVEEARRGVAELTGDAYRELESSTFGMTDDYGQPFLYVRFDRGNPTATRNPNFDLWSVADSGTDGLVSDAGTEDHPEWIKNW